MEMSSVANGSLGIPIKQPHVLQITAPEVMSRAHVSGAVASVHARTIPALLLNLLWLERLEAAIGYLPTPTLSLMKNASADTVMLM
jgi:hypothetical protein